MSHLTSNIPLKMFYFAFGLEILRTCRTTSNSETFCKISGNLIPRMSQHGGQVNVFTRTLTKIYDRLRLKYNDTQWGIFRYSFKIFLDSDREQNSKYLICKTGVASYITFKSH